jgi:hypothetical protein
MTEGADEHATLCSALIAISSSTKKTWLSLNSDHIPEFRDSVAAAGERSWLSVSLPAPALVTYGVLVR